MAKYRIEVLYPDGRIDGEEIEAEDDTSAIKMLPERAPIYSGAVGPDDIVKLLRREGENLIFVGQTTAGTLVMVPSTSQLA